MDSLGDKLKHLRQIKRYTQLDVADKLQISNKTLSDYERNRSEPDIEMLKKLSKLYEVSIDYLLDNTIKSVLDKNLFIDDFQFALYGEVKELTEDQKQDLLDMIKILKRQNK